MWSLKTGGLLIEGHLTYNVRIGEMKMWPLNGGGLFNRSGRSVTRELPSLTQSGSHFDSLKPDFGQNDTVIFGQILFIC